MGQFRDIMDALCLLVQQRVQVMIDLGLVSVILDMVATRSFIGGVMDCMGRKHISDNPCSMHWSRPFWGGFHGLHEASDLFVGS